MRGSDALYRLPVDFLEAVNGATKRIRVCTRCLRSGKVTKVA